MNKRKWIKQEEDWYRLHVPPIMIYVWIDAEAHRSGDEREWSTVMQFGEKQVTRGGFLTMQDAKDYAVEHGIELCEMLIEELKEVKGDAQTT